MTSVAPLTPAACDLRGMPFMPLDVVRLLDSDLFALSTGDEFKAAIALWCKAWNQVPAASLPCDDRILARHAGLSHREWAAVKAQALRGWVLCSDGRLYHPVCAEKALEAWAARERQRERVNKRWAKQRAAVEVERVPTDYGGDTAVCAAEDAAVDAAAIQGTGTGTGNTGSVAIAPEPERALLRAAVPLRKRKAPSGLSEIGSQAWAAFPQRGRERSSTKLVAEQWREAAERAGGEDRLLAAVQGYARTDRDAKGDAGAPAMHRWLRDARFENWLGSASPCVSAPVFAGPEQLRIAIAEAQGEGFAVGYLDPCHWQSDPPVLFARTGVAADALRQRCGPILGRFGINVQQRAQA